MKTKNEVYVIVDTPKKAKKLKEVLDMFGEEFSVTDGNAIKTGAYKGSAELYTEFNKSYFTGHNWTLMPTCSERLEVSIKELRNILAVEHLKEGDVVVIENEIGTKWVVKLTGGKYLEHSLSYNIYNGVFNNYTMQASSCKLIRYATEEEKELLRVKSLQSQAKEVLKPVKKELEVGKWYSLETVIIRITKLGADGEVYGYGLNTATNTWIEEDETPWYDYQVTRKATPQEVGKSLIEEAKRMGHAYSEYDYNTEENELCGINDGRLESVFCDGHWEQPADKFAELKEAHRNGAEIQLYDEKREYWWDCGIPCWNPNFEYRIKPEEIKYSDIATIEALHDVLLDNHKYDLNSKLLTNARELCKKLQNIVGGN